MALPQISPVTAVKVPPVIYVGPTLDRGAVKKWVPHAQLMPPIRRGDLYRDRLLGFTTFLILDGVFLERLAISPREIIDVLRDGAVVFGASSMGAIRAADCWPAGMKGIGTIYRLFRRGILTSDDEVAVAFSPRPPYPASTVPLVNVRYAMTRAVRRGVCSPATAERIVQAACELHFTDRDWMSILNSSVPDDLDRVLEFCRTEDLKSLDAVRALKAIRAWRPKPRVVSRSRTLLPSGAPSGGAPREAVSYPISPPSSVESGHLWRWLLATGRYRAYASGLADAARTGRLHGKGGLRPRRRALAEAESEEAACLDASSHAAPWLRLDLPAVAAALERGRSTPLLFSTLWAHESVFGPAVWSDMSASGDTAAIVARWSAVRRAVQDARVREGHPNASDWYLARAEIANNHGFRTWEDLRSVLGGEAGTWIPIEQVSKELALAKMLRRELFR